MKCENQVKKECRNFAGMIEVLFITEQEFIKTEENLVVLKLFSCFCSILSLMMQVPFSFSEVND